MENVKIRISDLSSVHTRCSKELPNIPIKLGLEVDYFEDGHEWIEELSQMADYDYLIGSVHYIALDLI